MSLKKNFKRYYFGLQGWFPYFGTRVYFPKNSGSFLGACEQGIYELENVRVLTSFTKPGTTCLEVGSNIGLMAAPILAEHATCRVVSFEPSPNAGTFLRRTISQSKYSDRWQLVEKAVGAQIGHADFHMTAGTGGLFDGLKNTNRATVVGSTSVEVTTLDTEWKRLGQPTVSMIKIDVEGAELDVLTGACECVRSQRPDILLEWTGKNLPAYGLKPEELLTRAAAMKYEIFTVPYFIQVNTLAMLELQMINTESFFLRPAPSVKTP